MTGAALSTQRSCFTVKASRYITHIKRLNNPEKYVERFLKSIEPLAKARDVVRVHPRGERARQRLGVFATRSPHRPNPIGLHRVEVLAVDGL